MAETPSPGPTPSERAAGNSEQSAYWNDVAGPRWVAAQERLDAQIRPLGLAAMERLGIEPGQQILDVGCGCGDTSLELAARVGPTGSVRGIDLSQPMLARARDRARAAGVAHLEFQCADAQETRFEGELRDRVFSRFGVMFFSEPAAAFRNLGRSLRPGGRIGFVCWQEVARNPYFYVPLAAAAAHIDVPPRAAPDAPGPFALADRARLHGILQDAGFSQIEIEDHAAEISAGSMDSALSFYLQIGPLGALLREREASRELTERVTEAVRKALGPFEREGGIRVPAAAWLVCARRP
ncbi:MAG: class I SAM-dependent methyltransferase [Myxococcota bacterium]